MNLFRASGRSICLLAAALLGTSVTSSAATINLWHAMNGSVGDAVQAMCSRFNASQTAHRVQCSYQGDYARLMQKTIAAFRAGRQPTLVQFFDVALRDLMESGAVQPLGVLYANQDDAAWQDGLLAPVRDWYADSRGQLVGQPFNVSTVLLYVNDSQLNAAGVASAPTTWERMREAGIALKAAGSKCPFVTDLDAWTTLEQYAASQGFAIAEPRNGHDAEGLDVRYTLDTSGLRSHVQWMVEGVREGWMRLDTQTRASEVASSFRSGECAMLLAATGMWSGIQSTIGLKQKVSVHAIPIASGAMRHRTNIGGAALYLMRGADAPKQAAAAAFLRFIRQVDEQLKFADDTGFLPYTEEAVQARRARVGSRAPAQDAVEAGLESLSHSSAPEAPSLRLGFYPQFRAAWKEELQRSILGEQDARQMLERMERRGNDLLQRFARTYPERARTP